MYFFVSIIKPRWPPSKGFNIGPYGKMKIIFLRNDKFD
jgi:hypothetical protein